VASAPYPLSLGLGRDGLRALGELTGHLKHDELRAVEDALLLVLDLP
jgi:hypothetical protein